MDECICWRSRVSRVRLAKEKIKIKMKKYIKIRKILLDCYPTYWESATGGTFLSTKRLVFTNSQFANFETGAFIIQAGKMPFSFSFSFFMFSNDFSNTTPCNHWTSIPNKKKLWRFFHMERWNGSCFPFQAFFVMLLLVQKWDAVSETILRSNSHWVKVEGQWIGVRLMLRIDIFHNEKQKR